MEKPKSLSRKILRAMIILVIVMLLAAASIFFLTVNNASETIDSSNKSLSSTIGSQSSTYITEQSQIRLMELAVEKAEIAEDLFREFRSGVSIAASVAESIYGDPSAYSPRPVPLPDPDNDGQLSMQVLYSANTDPNDPAVKKELGLIGNVQDALIAVNENHENIASIYVATESGFMVQADYISAKKFDEAGNLMPLEAKDRPWYQGAAKTGKAFFTPVTKDAHTPRLAIMCGVPVYADGKLMGVAGGGMYLDEMEDLVQSVRLGESGNACIINDRGQVLFSTFKSGTLAAVEGAPDLRFSKENAQLAYIVTKAVSGRSGYVQIDIDGVPSYLSYAPMETVGWSMLVFISRDSVEAPTKKLLDNVDTMTQQASQAADTHIRNAVIMLIALLAAAVLISLIVSYALSRRIVKPIRLLTNEIKTMDGDKLDFDLKLNTGDETEMLANSFKSLTTRMKNYISDIESITAERERISTELSVANRIQTSMLPNIFPPYPNRSQFDLFASMDPAREVGGDFYDFFLIDDDHLGLVMADVSGKGVPAALFMMASKIILQSHAMLGLSPGEILTRTNDAICSNNDEQMFVTVWVGVLDIPTGKLTAANAGHEYPAVMNSSGKYELLKDPHGLAVGCFGGQKYREYTLQLEPGSKVFLYTDGLPEAMGGADQNEIFGTVRMLDALNMVVDASPEKTLEHIRSTLSKFVDTAEQFDDLTMMCLEYKG